jgi:flagellar hook-associated protein 2
MATISGPTQSAIDVAGIVSQLMSVEKRPLMKLAQKEAGIQSKMSAFGSIKGALTSFREAFARLNNLSTYQSVKASSSDEAQVKVSAGANAPSGAHAVRITELASAHAVASAAYASRDAVVGAGTLTFQKGSVVSAAFSPNAAFAAKTVAISAAQNTLAGIRDAVNGAKIGVAASIVNDGTGSRLVFSSTDGAANSLKVSVSDVDGSHTDNAGLSALAYDPLSAMGSGKNLTEMRPAKDAVAIIDGIIVTSASNVITTAIDGITFTALAISPAAARISVEADNAGIKEGVEAFVKSYNELITNIKELTSFNATTKQAGPLNGDATMRALQSELRSFITTKLAGSGPLQSLNDLGIAFDKAGVLTLDGAKLQKHLENDRTAIAQLFARSGHASDNRISFVKAGANTNTGNYEIAITQAPAQGTLVGNQDAQLTFTTGVNNMLQVTIDGVQASITLPTGTYGSIAELAADLQSRINGNATLGAAGIGVAVTASAGRLTMTSNRYGAASTVGISGDGGMALFGNTPVATSGVDVAGTIGEVAANGNGQVLTGAGKATGIELKVNATNVGALGTVRYFEGITAKLDARVAEIVGPKGWIKARTDGYETSSKAVNQQMTEFNLRLVKLEERYRRQYSALDATLAKMSSTSAYLQQQLAAIAANSRAK